MVRHYTKFIKYSQHGDATKFHKDLDFLYDLLITTRGKMTLSIGMMDQFIVENGLSCEDYMSGDAAHADVVAICDLTYKDKVITTILVSNSKLQKLK